MADISRSASGGSSSSLGTEAVAGPPSFAAEASDDSSSESSSSMTNCAAACSVPTTVSEGFGLRFQSVSCSKEFSVSYTTGMMRPRTRRQFRASLVGSRRSVPETEPHVAAIFATGEKVDVAGEGKV